MFVCVLTLLSEEDRWHEHECTTRCSGEGVILTQSQIKGYRPHKLQLVLHYIHMHIRHGTIIIMYNSLGLGSSLRLASNFISERPLKVENPRAWSTLASEQKE